MEAKDYVKEHLIKPILNEVLGDVFRVSTLMLGERDKNMTVDDVVNEIRANIKDGYIDTMISAYMWQDKEGKPQFTIIIRGKSGKVLGCIVDMFMGALPDMPSDSDHIFKTLMALFGYRYIVYKGFPIQSLNANTIKSFFKLFKNEQN